MKKIYFSVALLILLLFPLVYADTSLSTNITAVLPAENATLTPTPTITQPPYSGGGGGSSYYYSDFSTITTKPTTTDTAPAIIAPTMPPLPTTYVPTIVPVVPTALTTVPTTSTPIQEVAPVSFTGPALPDFGTILLILGILVLIIILVLVYFWWRNKREWG